MGTFLVVFDVVVTRLDDVPTFTPGGVGARLTALAIAGVLWFVIETFFWAFVTFKPSQLSRRYLWVLALQDWPVAASVLTTGVLFAGLSPEGHSDRTADLATAIAQEVGLSPDEVTELSYASLMHDIGRITLNEPNIIRMGFTDEDIARWGSEIISEAPYLSDVAHLVRNQHNPYRRPGEHEDVGLPMSSRIIKVASAYDHATADLGMSALEALEVLHRGAAYDYDPQVVHAVRRVLVRRRVVAN